MKTEKITLVLNEDKSNTFSCNTKLFYEILDDYLSYSYRLQENGFIDSHDKAISESKQNLCIKLMESIQDSGLLI